MKRLRIISLIILAVTILVFTYNIFIEELPDCIVRINGGIMLVAIVLTSYSTVRFMKDEKK